MGRMNGLVSLAVAAGLVALASPAAHGVTIGKAGGLAYVKKTVTVPASPSGEAGVLVEVKCGRGKAAVGGGAGVSGAPRKSFLKGVGPGPQTRVWDADGWHVEQPDRKLTVYGICGKASRYTDDTHVESAPAAPASANSTASCESGHAVGGGTTPLGDTTDWWLNSTFPVDDGTDSDSIPDDGWRSYGFHREGPATSILAHVVCRKGGMPVYRQKAGTLEPDEVITLTARCRGGRVVIGGGAFVAGTASQAWVVASRPYDSKDKGRVPEDGWTVKIVSDAGSPLNASSQAICV